MKSYSKSYYLLNREKLKIAHRKYYSENSQKVKDKSRRIYYANKEKVLKRTKEWRKNNRERYNYLVKRHHLKDQNKVRARTLLWDAIRKGEIEKSPCVKCKSTKFIHAHHPDYSKPLFVVWLCSPCHSLVHHPH